MEHNKKNAQSTSKLTFDKVSKKLATDCTPPAARIDVDALKTTDPNTKKTVYFVSGDYDSTKNDDVHACGDQPPSVSPPTITGNGTYTISVTVGSGKGNLNHLTISVNGTTINDQQIAGPGTYTATYTAPDNSPFTVTATATDDLYYTGTASQTKS